jgi:4,5-dihydroxyphthalate decarboxylase
MSLVNVLRVSLPWIAAEAEAQSALFGGNPWTYGFKRNRDEIAAMIRYAVEDGLAARRMEPEELFHPSVLDLME